MAFKGGQHVVKHGGIARLQVRPVKNEQRGRCTGRHRRTKHACLRLVDRHRGQRLWWRRALADAKSRMADECVKGQRVVATAFAQATPQLVAVFGRGGAAHQQLHVFDVVA